LAGEAANGQIVREIGKSQGLLTLFEIAEVASWFTVTDQRPTCGIIGYKIYSTTLTELSPADTDLYARLDGANYGGDGLIKIDTTEAVTGTIIVPDFYIAAINPNADFLTDIVKVTLTCLNVDAITSAYNEANTENFVESYTTDGNVFKIYIGTPSVTETIVLSNALSFTTPVTACTAENIDLVTDDTGTTPYAGAVFTEADFTLTIDTSAAFYGPLYVKAITYVPEVFAVDKVLVTICGDQTITNADPTNAVFTITGTKSGTSEWTPFSLDGIWTTASATLPLNECPVTDIQVCEDSACLTILTEVSGLRITSTEGVFSLEIDKSIVVADPLITRHLKVISNNIEIIESFTVNLIDCSAQVISLAGEALSPITRELGKNNGLLSLLSTVETSAYFTVSDARPECEITEYLLYKTESDELT